MTNQGGHLTGAPKLTQYATTRRAGDLLFLAGVSSRQPDNTIKGASRGSSGAIEVDIRAQTRGCIENLGSALEHAGLGLRDLVDVTVFLVSMADYGGFNEAWNEFFTADGPTRTTAWAATPLKPLRLIAFARSLPSHNLSGGRGLRGGDQAAKFQVCGLRSIAEASRADRGLA